jgi:sensor c-di-GMP phosphodiesterase-like protein
MIPHRITPYAIAFLSFLGIFVGGLALGGYEAALRSISEKEATAAYAAKFINDTSQLILGLANVQGPECSEPKLRELRHIEYANNNISDIAVINDDNQIICTTTLGLLDKTIPALKPDYSVVAGEQRIEVNENAFDYLAVAGAPESRARLRHVQVTLSSGILERTRAGGFTAVGVIGPEGRFVVTRGRLKEEGRADELAELVKARIEDWGHTKRRWSWQHMALEMVYRVDNVPFVYFQREPIFVGPATSLNFKIVMLMVAFVAAMMVHAYASAGLHRRQSMAYRIKGLLKAQNIRCVYQPIYSLQTDRIVGCEVLVRLQAGQQMLMPDQFLPAVIERGITRQLDALVIARSLRELHAQIPKGECFEIALNLFPENIKSKWLHDTISGLSWNQDSGFTINLEVLEQAYQDDVLLEIAELKKLGYRVCVDDFGTGYSNLGSIKKMKPHYLKIDRSFVRDMETATLRSSLIPEIVAIARASGALLIAEGIENKQQLDALRDLGVEFGQGYYLGRPMQLDQLVSRLSDQRSNVIDLASRRLSPV